MDKTYPIGTKIKYTGTYDDYYSGELLTGMIGTIVGIVRGYPLIYLPRAGFRSSYSTKECPATVQTSWCRIEKLAQKNEQLLFSFME